MSRLATLALALALAFALHAPPAAAQTLYSWTGTESIQTERMTRDGIVSSHLLPPKAFPGIEPLTPQSYLYTTFAYVNPYAVAAPFLVDVIGSTGGVFGGAHFAAYLGTYDPAALATNYLGDSGYSCHAHPGCDLMDFSVMAPAHATVQLVVLRLDGGIGQGGFFEFDAGFARRQSVVPEPATWTLLAAGLAFLPLARRVHRGRDA